MPPVFLIILSQLISFHHANEAIPICIQNTHYVNKMATVSIYKMGTTLNLNNIKVAFCGVSNNLVTYDL